MYVSDFNDAFEDLQFDVEKLSGTGVVGLVGSQVVATTTLAEDFRF